MTFGKQLLFDDLPFTQFEIQQHIDNGFITSRNGLVTNRGSVQCVRCGNQDSSWFGVFPCARCGQTCTYCRKCIMMGRISSCTQLLSWKGPVPILINQEGIDAKSLLSWSGTLSLGQKQASSAVAAALLKQTEILVWAVCGAGKTEVLFEGINQALVNGLRVCIATPRTDVVLELTPRLKQAFPTISVASLYGGSPDRHLLAPLTIATTHQLLRFYQAFDCIIVDEVDAFPYTADDALQYAVRQARKPNSALVYLTATPNQQWQKRCRQGKLSHVKIPARYHRHPLPVPEFQWCGNWNKMLTKNKRLPKNVIQWLERRISSDKQILLFAPKIELLQVLLPILRAAFPSGKIETVHAEDSERKEKVMRMRNHEITLLVTTTILERGVTFSNLDVAVLGAEDQIFTESALVQIAGRVGRKAKHPSGTITFFHFGKTNAMVQARKQIVQMNNEAKQLGLLD
ncbi:DEAD/DEAH box helicase [Bacillus sp. DNRA2]|uniref:DEAD/DEAH box helicase n=1 Tax=Bacillus sp. DNRA2 TaxID=2723053 RepID=UPI00145ED32A|nr:DEAD/DEAH box helicase [Bacillus sp. DNRA2]NMD68823.1 DEAD/DEAH box helicase [Bacillus sp. DNRA2]